MPDKKDKRDYQFGDGRLMAEVLQENGQWDEYIPDYEAQSNQYFDTMHCWVFGTLNCLETLLRRKYGVKDNYSERYIGVLGGATTSGGMPRNASEAIRTKGNIKQESLPFSDNIKTFWQYSSPRPMTQNYLNEGKLWLNEYTYGYDYVKTTYGSWIWRKAIEIFKRKKVSANWQEIVKDALRFSPLGVSVCAWKFRNGLAYKNSYDRDNHWLMLYGYEDGKYWKLYDHYNKMFVQAEWNYAFGFIMRYTVYKNNPNTTMLRTIKARTKPEIYVVSESDPKEIMWVGGWLTYKESLDRGWLSPVEEVESLNGYKILEGVWGIIK